MALPFVSSDLMKFLSSMLQFLKPDEILDTIFLSII